MVEFNLKLLIFVGFISFAVIPSLVWWFLKRRIVWSDLPVSTGWRVCETLPFGVIILKSNDRIAFMNTMAQRLLSQMGSNSPTEIHNTLQKFKDSSIPEGPDRSGIIHQPLFLRWWKYFLDDQSSLLVLAEAGDQQRFVRQQTFIGQLVHELRTPLTSLVSHAEIVSSNTSPEIARSTSAQTIQNGAQRMARLVRDLLELYKLETTEDLYLRPTNLVLVAEDAVSQLILEAEEQNIILKFEAEANIPEVMAHSDRLKQVFLNLIDNSIKYCRPGDEIEVSLSKQTEGILCQVRDTGPGIASTHLPYITERLYRVRTDVEGAGLGLALVDEILRRHNTSLSIESVWENEITGTTCRWTLSYMPRFRQYNKF